MPTSAELAGTIAEYDKNKVTSTDALNEALKQFGVPEIRQNVAGLRSTVANTASALKSVDPSVTGRTQGSLVTEAQRLRQVNNERAPIAEQLSGFTSNLGDQERILSENTNQATTTASNRVRDYETGRQALQSQYDDIYKREQDTAQAEAQRQAFAESQRQFNEGQATSRGSASYGGSGGKASAADTKAAVAQHVAQGLSSSTGRDGYVSNETFAAALNDYQAAGLGNVRTFWQNYGRFVNPKYKSSYAGYAQR